MGLPLLPPPIAVSLLFFLPLLIVYSFLPLSPKTPMLRILSFVMAASHFWVPIYVTVSSCSIMNYPKSLWLKIAIIPHSSHVCRSAGDWLIQAELDWSSLSPLSFDLGDQLP